MRYALEPDVDQFFLLENGSLIRLRPLEILEPGKFCLETVDVGDEHANQWTTTAMVCFTNADITYGTSAIFRIYAFGKPL